MMIEASLDEGLRAACLAACCILDTPPEKEYDELTELACSILESPISLVSLLDNDRQWFKSMRGLQFTETPRHYSFCKHAMLAPDRVLVVPDTLLDERFYRNALVTSAPNIRFYAGAPLVLSDGCVIGTLCVLDVKPRKLSESQLDNLRKLANQASRLIDSRRVLRQLVETKQNLQQAKLSRVQADEQYRSLFENHPSAMILSDSRTGEILDWNPAAESLYGYTTEEFAAAKISDFSRNRNVDVTISFTLPLESGVPVRIVRHFHKSGAQLTVEVRTNDLEINGRRCRIISLVDITRRTEIEIALKRQQREFSSAFDYAPVGMAMVYPDNRIFRVNRAFSRMLGYSEDEIFLSRFTAITHPDDRANDKMHIEQLIAGDVESLSVEKRYLHKDGREIWSYFSATLVRDESGMPLHFISQIVDITETKIAKMALKESQAKLDLIFKAQVEGVVVQDKTGRILVANPAAEQILGVSELGKRSSVDGGWKTIREDGTNYPGDEHPAMVAIRTGQASRDSIMGVHRPDGKLVWISINAAPLTDEQGQAHMVVCSFSDVTHKKVLEEQLRQAQKMEVVGRLAGGVAHDFNNILTAMLLNLQQCMEAVPSAKPALEEVHILATQGVKLTRQLLEFARQQPMALVPMEIKTEVAKFMTMIRRIIGDTIHVTIEQEAKESWVSADASMLDQALLNMIVNAKDAMPHGGVLTVRTSQVELGTPKPGNRYARPGSFFLITISDNGTGMSPDVLEHLFEPFFTTKGIGKGTGLGLASAYGTIHQHRGWIEVESMLGTGSKFHVYLPITQERPKSGPALLPPVRRSEKETILLVEDHPFVRRSTIKILEKFGYHVLVANDGLEAMEVWEQHSKIINLLLTDMMMPNGMTGLELGTRLRTENPTLKIILVSGYSESILKEEGIDLPNVRFLAKPYEQDALSRTIREVLDSLPASGNTLPNGLTRC